MPIQVTTILPHRHRATYQRRPFSVVLDGWRLSIVGGALVTLAATSVIAIVLR